MQILIGDAKARSELGWKPEQATLHEGLCATDVAT